MVNTSSSAQIAASILAKLAITVPGMSFELGTPERKIVDAVGEAISEATLDQYLTTQNWDLDTLTGTDLERFVGIFGFGRLAGSTSTGQVTFYLAGMATQDYNIPAGTLIYAPATNARAEITFTTLIPAVIPTASSSVIVDSQCSQVGTIGNVTSDTIIGVSGGIGVASVNNVNPFTGGSDAETDDSLRDRFKQTFLRNIAGTPDFYQAIAQRDLTTSKVNVLGPISRYTEQLQTTGSPLTSSILNSKYTWPNGNMVSIELGSIDEQFYNPGTDYNMSTTVPPILTIVNTIAIPTGTVLDVQHEYVSLASRNDPANGISNKIDIYVNGSNPVQVTEVTQISSDTLNTTVGSRLNVANFKRVSTEVAPTTGHRIQILGSTPILSFPASILVGVTTYVAGTDYELLRGTTTTRGSEREVTGIEWLTTAPTAAAPVTFVYVYNRLPQILNAIFKKEKQITTDPLVHTNLYQYLRINLLVVYAAGYSPTAVKAQIDIALGQWIDSLDYAAWIQFSDIEAIAHNVPGVDQVRMRRSTDGAATWGVETMVNGVSVTTHTVNFQLLDDTLPSLFSVDVVRRASNSWTP